MLSADENSSNGSKNVEETNDRNGRMYIVLMDLYTLNEYSDIC